MGSHRVRDHLRFVALSLLDAVADVPISRLAALAADKSIYSRGAERVHAQLITA